ncbi:MAG: hypothetical protein IPI67_20710 [Myxococcales bacterium]|nr:hypothetical protein [Myxococcales bacterium]
MHHVRWTALALVGLGGLWLTVRSSTVPTTPAAIGRNLGAEVAGLEARVSAHPGDAEALCQLTDAYLAGAAPGVAQAALERAPAELRRLPAVADARARTLWQLGFTQAALEVQRGMLDTCTEAPCAPVLIGRAQRRERLLSELVRQGVEDPRQDPSRTRLAYRVSMREVSLDLR